MADLTADIGAELRTRLPDLRSHKKLDAVVAASRAAVLVAVPRLRGEHDAVVARRGPARPGRPSLWTPREVLALAALLTGFIAAALVLPSPRNGRPALGVDNAALWVGVLAAATLIVFALLEPGRRDSLLFGAHTRNAPKMYIFLAVLWALVFAYMLANWDDVDRWEPALPTTGLVLLGASIVGIAVLAVVARRHDKAALAEPDVAAKDDWGRSAKDADPVEEWWVALPAKLSPAERGAADRSYRAALDVLEREQLIRPADGKRLRRKNPPVVWRGDAG
ncbi:hypothetical protein [Microbacterium hibisci]|uniref:hypothetical protein n=1 Tax=Microbacterium hibisci TaxID=2036000 RepID=UPI0019453AC0|nr:hypothetical protein [Microbacterium hibisci]